jgi:hypothetical protein
MSSRQEEKERRRQERLAREQQEAAAAGRRKRLQYAFGALLAVAAVVGVVILIGGAGGDGGGGVDTNTDPSTPAANLPELPAPAESDFEKAAKEAGCELINPAYEGAGHEEREFTAGDYKTNPPTSGTHFPSWAEDGIYEAGNVPPLGELVHTLEHGRINVQYKPGTPTDVVLKLEALLAEQNDGYHMLLYENPTGMDYQVAATAWTHILGCPKYNDKVPDAIRTFRARYIDQGPERVP